MRIMLALLFILAPATWAGNVLMIDLNDSGKEVAACYKGVRDASTVNQDGSRNEALYVVNKEHMAELQHHKYTAGNKIHAEDIEAYIREIEDGGHKIDTIVISGHDGNGQYFGTQGDITASQLKGIFNRHRLTRDNVSTLVQWGCYTGNANACENIWGKHISQNINTTIGFTVQSPDNTRPGNFALLEDVCKKRKAIHESTTQEQYDKIFNNLAGVQDWNVGICKPEGVCSPDYARRDADGKVIPGQSCFHSYDELQRRCREFDPDHEMNNTYLKYLNAEPGYENPPLDDASFVYENGKKGRNPIRNYYSELHLWRHCAKTEYNPYGADMESPARAIRLTRFEDVKQNLLKFHPEQIQQYNQLLAQVGLGEFALDNITDSTRKQIIDKTMGAVSGVEDLLKHRKAKNGVNLSWLFEMTKQFDRVLRILQPPCIPFSWVHAGMGDYASQCIAPYGKTPAWLPK